MGGIGSGRRPGYAGKDATEDSMPLDIRRLGRAGVLAPGRSCSWQWTLNDRVPIFIRSSAVMKRFAGLRSRWTMPFSCAAARPSAICDA